MVFSIKIFKSFFLIVTIEIIYLKKKKNKNSVYSKGVHATPKLVQPAQLDCTQLSPLDLIASADQLWVSPLKPEQTIPTEMQRKFGGKTLGRAYIHQI